MKRLALCSKQINTEQVTVVVGPSQSKISSVLEFRIVANGPFTPLVIAPPSILVTLLQACLGINDLAKASTVLGLGTPAKPGVLTKPQYDKIMLQPSPSPSPPPSPFPPPPSPVAAEKKIKLVEGWQMCSFQYLDVGSSSFSVIEKTPSFTQNDKILARLGSLKIATYDGTKWQGELVAIGLDFAHGYKVYFKSAAGGVITQTGVNQDPVEAIKLTKGWNWIGNAPLYPTAVNDLTPTDGSFTVDDEIKSRAADITFTRYDGNKFQGALDELEPGRGYEVKVRKSVTVQFGSLSPQPLPLPSDAPSPPPPTQLPSPLPPPPTPSPPLPSPSLPSPSPPPPTPSPPPPSPPLTCVFTSTSLLKEMVKEYIANRTD